jgi:hypothetical protein
MQDNEANAAPAADAQQPTPENQALMEMYDVFLEELGEGEQFENVMNDIAWPKVFSTDPAITIVLLRTNSWLNTSTKTVAGVESRCISKKAFEWNKAHITKQQTPRVSDVHGSQEQLAAALLKMQNSETTVATTLQKEADRRMYPYTAEREKFKRMSEGFATESDVNLYKKLREHVDARRLSPDFLIYINYLLSEDPEDKKRFLGMVLDITCPVERLKFHQWHIAECKATDSGNPDHYFQRHGDTIVKCNFFAMPPVLNGKMKESKETESLRTALESATAGVFRHADWTGDDQVSGAGSRDDNLQVKNKSNFGKVSKSDFKTTVKGAGSIPIFQKADGNWAADTKEVEQAFNNQQKQIDELRKEKKTSNSYSGRARGEGRGGRGGDRGRGGNRGRDHYGGYESYNNGGYSNSDGNASGNNTGRGGGGGNSNNNSYNNRYNNNRGGNSSYARGGDATEENPHQTPDF